VSHFRPNLRLLLVVLAALPQGIAWTVCACPTEPAACCAQVATCCAGREGSSAPGPQATNPTACGCVRVDVPARAPTLRGDTPTIATATAAPPAAPDDLWIAPASAPRLEAKGPGRDRAPPPRRLRPLLI
jgi:hypothetical protein